MSEHTDPITGMTFTLPKWTDDDPAIAAYAKIHAGFREAVKIVPARSRSQGAAFLRAHLRRIARVEIAKIEVR